MDFLQIVIITLHITYVVTKSKSKKYDASSSDETIENLLYFKDCQRKPKEPVTTTEPVIVRLASPTPPPTPPQPDCPFPKMCCALTCGNECGGPPQIKERSFLARPMEPMQMQRQGIQPIIPMMHPRQPVMPVQPQIRKRKKMKFPMSKMQPPISSRRDFGFAKQKIKNLISQDDDIKKILKDLVRVTMQKVDLADMINDPNAGRRGGQLDMNSIINTLPSTLPVYDEYDE